ncbi:MAG TPA: hypothetical protein VNT22_06365 [Baekduia sp.]|nr:hypothetical protein [Baekduia sp.]
MTTIALAGALANKHTAGGSIWVRVSWAAALRSLGFDVLFIDQIDKVDCVDARGRPTAFAASANVDTFTRVTGAFGLSGSAALVCADDGETIGMSNSRLRARLRDSALLVNLGGHLRIDSLTRLAACLAFVDLDPAYTQVWHATGLDRSGLSDHHLHFSVGGNVGGPRWALPTAGIEWQPVRQPVVLEHWPVSGDSRFTGFSTVASWRGAFGPLAWDGQTYGVKAHSFRRFAGLPSMVDQDFSMVLDIEQSDAGDRSRLERAGWKLTSPDATACTDSFRRFVQRSGAEFSAAQDAYVRSRSGWFSDRTVRYLASGRPALIQDTGFSEQLPVGYGIVPFSDMDEAVAGARSIVDEYPRHRAAAREIAERYFAPAPALGPLLAAAGVSP